LKEGEHGFYKASQGHHTAQECVKQEQEEELVVEQPHTIDNLHKPKSKNGTADEHLPQ